MDIKPDRLAQRAQELLNDEVLLKALEEMAKEALIDLAAVDATDTPKILQLQAIVRNIQTLPDVLMGYIIAGGAYDGGDTEEERNRTSVN